MKKFGLYLLGLLSGFLLFFFVNDFGTYQIVINSIICGLFAAFASFFLDFTFREGNIFAFWLRFLNRFFFENKKNPFRFLYKPLGGCTICMNQYISILVFLLAFWKLDLSFWFLIPSSLVSHVSLFFMLKHFDLED